MEFGRHMIAIYVGIAFPVPLAAAQDLTGAAQSVCQQKFEQSWLKVYDLWTTLAEDYIGHRTTLAEVHSVTIRVSELSVADKLNGVDWSGEIDFVADAIRYAALNGLGPKWEEWQTPLIQPVFECLLQHQGSGWHVSQAASLVEYRGQRYGVSKPDQDAIPSSLRH
jgi:hypothetical protein